MLRLKTGPGSRRPSTVNKPTDTTPADAATVVEAGAQALVAGSAVYKGNPATEMRRIVDIAQRTAGKV